jgi:integrase
MADVDDRWHRIDRATGKRVRSAAYGIGGRWQARWRDGAGVQRKRNFERKIDAESFVNQMRSDLTRGTYVDPAAGRILLRVYAETQWLPAQRHLRPLSVELYGSHLRTHILPRLGGRPVRSLTRADINAFVTAICEGLAASTVVTVFAVLRALMQSAVHDGLIMTNPCSRIPLPRVEDRVLVPLPVAAVRALAESITPRYRVTVWLAAGAGLREGEALGLIVPRVDLAGRRLRIEQQMQRRELVPLKSRASRRVIPVDAVVVDAIRAHLGDWPPGDDQLVVTNRSGRPVQRSTFGTCWRDAVKKAGLPVGTRYHDLRHFYASTLIAAGVYPKVIQARMGHATLAETMDTYGHLFPEADDAGRGALDDAFGRTDVPPVCPPEDDETGTAR